MATIKSYTSLEQSEKLAEILPLESADMWWNYYSVTTDFGTPQIVHLNTPWVGNFNWYNKPDNVPCWSLSALLDILPEEYTNLIIKEGGMYRTLIKNFCMTPWFDNPIDACVTTIEKLHELKML